VCGRFTQKYIGKSFSGSTGSRSRQELRAVPMRWQLISPWWKKPLKELPATFKRGAETVAGQCSEMHSSTPDA